MSNWINHVGSGLQYFGLMQHHDHPQDSHSVSSDVVASFTVEGPPVTLELPLPTGPSPNRKIVLHHGSEISFDSDHQIKELASRLGLHPNFSPAPSVVMLMWDLCKKGPRTSGPFANEKSSARSQLELLPSFPCP